MHPAVLSGPDPPTGVSADVTGIDTAVVSWNPSRSRMCEILIRNYSVRYQLWNGTGGYTTVNTAGTSVTLQDLVPNAEYTVEVAAINSNGRISLFSVLTRFTVTPTTTALGKIHFAPILAV